MQQIVTDLSVAAAAAAAAAWAELPGKKPSPKW